MCVCVCVCVCVCMCVRISKRIAWRKLFLNELEDLIRLRALKWFQVFQSNTN